MTYPCESLNPETRMGGQRYCPIRKDPSSASPIAITVCSKFSVVTAYSAANDEGWIKVGYRGIWGWARADLFEQVCGSEVAIVTSKSVSLSLTSLGLPSDKRMSAL